LTSAVFLRKRNCKSLISMKEEGIELGAQL